MSRRMNAFEVGIIAFGATLNITIGYLVAALKLPLYLDSTGTIIVAVLCGWKHGILAGLAGLVAMTLISTPTVAAYAGTVMVIALLASLFARKGFLRKPVITIGGGLLIGVAAALTSSPVTAFLYGGVSLAGSDAITTAFRASGLSVWESVFFGSMIVELVDKTLTALLGMFLVRSLPLSLLDRFREAGAVILQQNPVQKPVKPSAVPDPDQPESSTNNVRNVTVTRSQTVITTVSETINSTDENTSQRKNKPQSHGKRGNN